MKLFQRKNCTWWWRFRLFLCNFAKSVQKFSFYLPAYLPNLPQSPLCYPVR